MLTPDQVKTGYRDGAFTLSVSGDAALTVTRPAHDDAVQALRDLWAQARPNTLTDTTV